ncbi:hypothetical protein RYX36_005305 [Vicia faba]
MWGKPTYSKARDSYDSRKQQNEIDPEKQKLAASLFGGSAKPERRTSTSSKVPKASAASVPDKESGEKTNQQPPP